MSFIKDVKKELIASNEKSDCCTLALLYGLILSSGSIAQNGGKKFLEIATGCENLIEKVNYIVEKLYGGYAELECDDDNVLNHTTYLIKIPFEFATRILFDLQMFSGGEFNFDFNPQIIESDCCKIAFLKGVFLASASSTIKIGQDKIRSGYHLEFVFQRDDLAEVVSELLAQAGIIERTVYRGNFIVVYLSDYDSILLLIGMFGASKSYLNLEAENVNRSVNKQVNRQMNFINANINRQSAVSAKQILAIREIDEIIKLSSLPSELYEVAVARLNNPELSLSDLISKIKTPLTKSGINHRMRKIMAIHKNLKN